MHEGLTIKEAAAACGLSVDTLRYYERLGLLGPIPRDGGGRRRYAPADLAWIAFLQRLRAGGMPLRQMHAFAELRRQGEITIPARRALLEEHAAALSTRITELEMHLASVREKIAHYRNMEENI